MGQSTPETIKLLQPTVSGVLELLTRWNYWEILDIITSQFAFSNLEHFEVGSRHVTGIGTTLCCWGCFTALNYQTQNTIVNLQDTWNCYCSFHVAIWISTLQFCLTCSWFMFNVLLCVWFTACFPSLLNHLKGTGWIPGQFISVLLSTNCPSNRCFCPTNSAVHYQRHSTSAPYLFISHCRCVSLATDSVFKLNHTQYKCR
jgi:hypothetical protein